MCYGEIMCIARTRLLVLVLGSVVASGGPGLALAGAPDRMPTEPSKLSPKQQLAQLRRQITNIESIAAELEALAKAPMPKGLPAEDRELFPRYSAFVSRSAEQLRSSAEDWTDVLDEVEPTLTTRDDPRAFLQELAMSFNLQYLQLQSQMQHENRSYTAVSNIMKTKHDTVKNSISNIR